MSHFTVAVFSDGTKTVEELLAPYQENNMGDWLNDAPFLAGHSSYCGKKIKVVE